MIWKNIVGLLGIAPRRRFVATTLVYGLSLAVRFTSATGEQVEIPPQSMQRTKPVTSIMYVANPRLPYEYFAANADQPIVLRAGWPLGIAGCRAGM
jgi:hypothetical protein